LYIHLILQELDLVQILENQLIKDNLMDCSIAVEKYLLEMESLDFIKDLLYLY